MNLEEIDRMNQICSHANQRTPIVLQDDQSNAEHKLTITQKLNALLTSAAIPSSFSSTHLLAAEQTWPRTCLEEEKHNDKIKSLYLFDRLSNTTKRNQILVLARHLTTTKQ
jgi:hypothetical protein